jgi:nitroreductase
MRFDDVILGRRSIRGYKPDPVPRALIEEIIGLAMRAPSSMNTQPWNFYIITGEPLDRIRAGNTERMVAGVPQSREFRSRPRRTRKALIGDSIFLAKGDLDCRLSGSGASKACDFIFKIPSNRRA